MKRVYDPTSKIPFAVSRSKIELFISCPRCFYLDRRRGVGRPSMPAFSLNSAVDVLLKREFDALRGTKTIHSLLETNHVHATPFEHPDLVKWRENFVGIRTVYEPANVEVFGAVDDIWVNKKGELIVVDFKSTSSSYPISLTGKWKESYKRQLEVYQWLLRQNGFSVAPVSYIVYANAGTYKPRFDNTLEFTLSLHAHRGTTDWIEPALMAMKDCLVKDTLPAAHDECEYCRYRQQAGQYEQSSGQLTL